MYVRTTLSVESWMRWTKIGGPFVIADKFCHFTTVWALSALKYDGLMQINLFTISPNSLKLVSFDYLPLLYVELA